MGSGVVLSPRHTPTQYLPLPASLPAWRRPLPFLYESTGDETMFTDGFDPEPRSRPVVTFHRPETMARWLRHWIDDAEAGSLRARLDRLNQRLALDEAHVATLAVHPGWRGRGLGELLFGTMVREARAAGAVMVTLEVREGNQAARRLYGRADLERIEVRTVDVGDERSVTIDATGRVGATARFGATAEDLAQCAAIEHDAARRAGATPDARPRGDEMSP